MTMANEVLAPEWKSWIIENLLLGASVEEVHAALAKEGVAQPTVAAALREILQSPIFSAASKIAKQVKRAELILRLQQKRSQLLSIETRPELSASAFHQHYRGANLPVLLPTFARDWPAVTRWTFQWLKETYGDQTITVSDNRDSDPDYDRHIEQLTVQTTVAQLVDRILSSGNTNNFYAVARNRNLQSGLTELWSDITPAEGFLTSKLKQNSAALWIGPGGTITPLHHDTSDILFCQIRGRKRLRLVGPYEIRLSQQAQGLYGPSMESVEADENIVVHDFELGPGETLFIPAGWWHHVVALEPSISVAINSFPDNNLSWYQPGY